MRAATFGSPGTRSTRMPIGLQLPVGSPWFRVGLNKVGTDNSRVLKQNPLSEMFHAYFKSRGFGITRLTAGMADPPKARRAKFLSLSPPTKCALIFAISTEGFLCLRMFPPSVPLRQ